MNDYYTQKGLIKAADEGCLYDYVANYYPQMTKDDLKEVILAILGVVYDNAKGDEDYNAFLKKVVDELGDRYFGEDEQL